jgi:hypothetical protein
MGVEIYTKDVFASSHRQCPSAPFFDLLLENPRDLSAAACSLFSKALPTIAGTNLDEEHKLLSKRVQKVFEARSRIGRALSRGWPFSPAAQSLTAAIHCIRDHCGLVEVNPGGHVGTELLVAGLLITPVPT